MIVFTDKGTYQVYSYMQYGVTMMDQGSFTLQGNRMSQRSFTTSRILTFTVTLDGNTMTCSSGNGSMTLVRVEQ